VAWMCGCNGNHLEDRVRWDGGIKMDVRINCKKLSSLI
jgi:hypothetical protein